MKSMASLRRTVALVALLNLAYFGVEFAVARAIGSVSLFADSIDFLEDAAVNGLILAALGWSLWWRSIVGMLLAAVLLAPALATLWTAWQKFHFLVPPLRYRCRSPGSARCGCGRVCGLSVRRAAAGPDKFRDPLPNGMKDL
jgi:divalent metal cation (Fe/Co/Zn/Cd) transporter